MHIATAAIRRNSDGKIFTLPRPARHHSLIAMMIKAGEQRPIGQEPRYTQGFVTDDGNFVNRDEAKEIALAANQVKNGKTISKTLTSEDLW